MGTNGILAARPVSHFVVAAPVKLNPFVMERIQLLASRLLRPLSKGPRRRPQLNHLPSRLKTCCISPLLFRSSPDPASHLTHIFPPTQPYPSPANARKPS